METLTNKAAKSFFWVAFDVFGQKILQFVIGIILARILLPQEYGLLGLISIFFAFSMIFIESGFTFTLVRKKNVEEIEYITVFWFNLTISLVFFLILFFTSPYIALFYKQEILTNIIRLTSLSLVINAFGYTQSIKLKKQFKFKQLTIIGIISKVISGIVSIYLAYQGYGVWSLVIQQLLMNCIRVTLMVGFNWFFPPLQFSISHFKELFSFSSKLLLGGIGYSISNNIYPMVIGKLFSISDVGFYNRAKGLRDLPVLMFTSIIQEVTLPTFSNIQDENERFLNSYRIAIKTSLFLVLLPLLILVISAEPLIELLLTEKWLPAAPMLKIIAIGSILYPVSALNVNIIGIKGRANYVMILQFIKDGLIYSSIFFGLIFGINGLLWSIAISGNLGFLINIYFTSKVVKYSLLSQLKDIFPDILLAIATGVIVYFISYNINGSIIFMIIIQTLLLCLFYIGISWLFKFQELRTSIDMVKKMIIK